MKLKSIALMTGLCTILINGRAQTPDDIIHKYIDAIGGKEKLSHIKTLYSKGEIDFMGNPAPSTTYIVTGKGYKNQIEFSGQQIVTCYTDKSGWTVNPMNGQTTPTPVPDDQLKIGQMAFDVAGPLFDYTEKGNKVELLGKENFNGTSVYKLKLTTASNMGIFFLIDSATYYPLKTTVNTTAGGQDFEIGYISSNYQKTEYGLVMPFTQEVSYPGLTITIKTAKVEINKEIDPAIFVMPAK